MSAPSLPQPDARPRLTSAQRRGFWAAWAGWTLDGMDSFIFALVLTPALTELLPKSGLPAAAPQVHAYGSIRMPVAATALAFLFGLLILPFCLETRGQRLPA